MQIINFFFEKSIFPYVIKQPNVIITGVNYHQKMFNKELFQYLGIPYPKSLNQATLKRKSEYLAGRYVAIESLIKLGYKVNNIPTGKYREPIWPPGVTGSITHTKSSAFSAVALNTNFKGIGIDHENWIPTKIANQIKSSIIIHQEEQLMNKINFTFEQKLTLIFSAKESLFKALFPSIQSYFDFKEVVVINISIETRSLTLKLLSNLSEKFKKDDLFDGKFSYDEDAVQTLVTIPQCN